MSEEKWEEILQACDAAKHRCLLTNPKSSFMNDKDRELFNDIYSEAIRGRDWSIYNEDTVQVFKEYLPDVKLIDAMAEDVLIEALDKWSQRAKIEKEKREAVQKAITEMKAEMNLALQEQEKELRAEYSKREGILIDKLGEKKRKKRSKRSGRKGPRTEFMKRQLRAFERFLSAHSYNGDESKLYALANQCWNANEKKWDKAKSATGQKKGYSSPKVMADAYRKSMS